MTAAPTERGVLAVLDRILADYSEAYEVREARAAVAEVYTQRDHYAARLSEDRAILDAIRAVAGGPYDTIAVRVAELIEERDALRGALNRIVTYYDLRKHSGRLPTMDSQAECEHELTMFGEARKVLARTERVS